MQQQIGRLQGTVRFKATKVTPILASKVTLVTPGLKMARFNYKSNQKRHLVWSLKFLNISRAPEKFLFKYNERNLLDGSQCLHKNKEN